MPTKLVKRVNWNTRTGPKEIPTIEDALLNTDEIAQAIISDATNEMDGGPFVRITLRNGIKMTCVGELKDFVSEGRTHKHWKCDKCGWRISSRFQPEFCNTARNGVQCDGVFRDFTPAPRPCPTEKELVGNLMGIPAYSSVSDHRCIKCDLERSRLKCLSRHDFMNLATSLRLNEENQ